MNGRLVLIDLINKYIGKGNYKQIKSNYPYLTLEFSSREQYYKAKDIIKDSTELKTFFPDYNKNFWTINFDYGIAKCQN